MIRCGLKKICLLIIIFTLTSCSTIQVVKVDKNIKRIDLFNSKGIYVSMNIFSFFGDQVYNFFNECPLNTIRNEKEIAVALQNMMRSTNNKIRVHELCEEVPDMTYKKDISKMSDYIEKNK